jgi:16S rRNA (adenine1518-N6/adenine1519-N6)-dimethyltransferase
MVQREVANRLMAAPGTKDYGSLSCFVQYHTNPVYLYTIKRTSFYPVPDVDSSLIRLEILDKPSVHVKDEALFFKVVRSSFNQRRKTILNSLSRELALNIPKDELSAIFERAGIAPSARPETLSLADFARIANAVSNQ